MKYLGLLLIFWTYGALACHYGKPAACPPHQYCINLEEGKTECRPLFAQPLLEIAFPFAKGTPITCDQGVLSPPDNSHTWLNTAYALDLMSERTPQTVPVQAGVAGKVIVQEGCVTENDQCGLGFGNAVKILTDEGFMVFYAHLKSVAVKTGDTVKAGQVIGIEGTTGWTGQDNRHLHLSVHHDWRGAGFDYWKSAGYLPASVPFKMSFCKSGCRPHCKSQTVDVRELECRRVEQKVKSLCW